jgi:8-oxo-dGTP pyrophosphatase MutT (NUDIX family)
MHSVALRVSERTEGGGGVVAAAGGAIWQAPQSGGEIEVVLVHRSRYDDWTLPKGKLDPGESYEAAALREVEEEAGLSCRLGPELPSTSYVDKGGRPKLVRYWAMTVLSGSVGGRHEVDDARWFQLPQARGQLTYPRDADVVDALEALIGGRKS